MLPNYDNWLYSRFRQDPNDSEREEFIASNYGELLGEFLDTYGSMWEEITEVALSLSVKLPDLAIDCNPSAWNYVINLMKRRIKGLENVQAKFDDFCQEQSYKVIN